MKELKEFTIPFAGLKLGKHQFEFEIKQAFFEYFDYEEFRNVDIHLDVLLDKLSTFLEFTLTFEGTVNVDCDVTNEAFDQEISGSYHFVVRFGDDFDDENEEILVIPHGSSEVNIQQYIFESIVLAMPLRRIHPGVEDGTLESDIIDKLEELSVKLEDEELPAEDDTDPRWDQLKKLLTDK